MAIITVTTLTDENNGTGDWSLREAIATTRVCFQNFKDSSIRNINENDDSIIFGFCKNTEVLGLIVGVFRAYAIQGVCNTPVL
jgi:CSLREA domain-containing protein